MFTAEEVLEEVFKGEKEEEVEKVEVLGRVGSEDRKLQSWIEEFSCEGDFDEVFFKESALTVLRPILEQSKIICSTTEGTFDLISTYIYSL